MSSFKHLLSVTHLTPDDTWRILETAHELEKITEGENKKLAVLRGKTVVNLFYEDSTRTRISFETAAKRLSADLINFSAKGSSVSKGESLKDTAQTLEAMGADVVIIRHPSSGAAHTLAHSQWINANIINAGDGTHEHPTQALLDLYTIAKAAGATFTNRNSDLELISQLKVTIVGDILHSRVARSNIYLLKSLGVEVTVVAPPTLLPWGIEKWGVNISYRLDSVIEQTDVLMQLRIQKERMDRGYFPNTNEYSRLYGLDRARLHMLKPAAIIMHPGPINRGLEIDAISADSSQSRIIQQVSNGVLVRMAILYLLGGAKNE
jgi:aspartate carbamoyltransferase catalytic subunit